MGKKKPPICNVGDRISGPGKSQGIVEHNAYTSIKPYKIRWDNGLFGIYNAKDFDKYGYKAHPPEPELKDIQEQEQLWSQLGIEDITPEQPQTTEFWRLKAGLHPVEYQEGIENFAIACHQLSLFEQLELCEKRITQQQERLAEIKRIKPSAARKAEESVTAAVAEENKRINQLQLQIKTAESASPHKFTGDENYPFQLGDIIECDYYRGRELEVVEVSDDAPTRIGVRFTDGVREGKTFYTDKVACHLLRRGNQSPACNQSEAQPSDSLINKHFYADHLEVIVEAIANPQNWRETPNSPIIRAVKVRPWWNKLRDRVLPESLLVPLEELTEVTNFSESPSKEFCSNSPENSLEKSQTHTEKERRWWVGDRLIGELNTGEIIDATDEEVTITWTNTKGGRCSEVYRRHQLKDLTDFQYEETPTKERESRQVGSLYQYTKNAEDKAGIIQTYPKVEGERRRDEDSHWYWGFSYIEKSLGKWRDKSAAIPRKKLSAVRKAIADGKPHTYILQEILNK